MYYLSSIDMCNSAELESELRHFFSRIHHIKRQLQQQRVSEHLNRIQRYRCKQNILDLERVERDFHALSHRDDVYHLYRKLHRYVKLDNQRLMETFGRETLNRCSMFIAL